MNTTPTELIIARHGEAHCNVEQIVGGPTGCKGLTDTGRAQALRLADHLSTENTARPFAALYTTPLRRVKETADIISGRLGKATTCVPALTETDYGTADGQPWTQVVNTFGRIPAQEPDLPIAPGAETWTQYLERSTAALERIITHHEGERVLVVGHGETVASAAHLFLDLPPTVRAHAGFAAHPASLTHWIQQPLTWTHPTTGWRWTLLTLNDTRQATTTTMASTTTSTTTTPTTTTSTAAPPTVTSTAPPAPPTTEAPPPAPSLSTTDLSRADKYGAPTRTVVCPTTDPAAARCNTNGGLPTLGCRR